MDANKTYQEKLKLVPSNLQKEHVFCSVCGNKMIAIRYYRFDPKTGDRLLCVRWQCVEGSEKHDAIEVA